MTDIADLLRRQAEWQKSRARLSWAEKLRLAETLRDGALAMGKHRKPASTSTDPDDSTRK